MQPFDLFELLKPLLMGVAFIFGVFSIWKALSSVAQESTYRTRVRFYRTGTYPRTIWKRRK